MEYPPDRPAVHAFADEPPRRDDARSASIGRALQLREGTYGGGSLSSI
jgi:hypothetical protein